MATEALTKLLKNLAKASTAFNKCRSLGGIHLVALEVVVPFPLCFPHSTFPDDFLKCEPLGYAYLL